MDEAALLALPYDERRLVVVSNRLAARADDSARPPVDAASEDEGKSRSNILEELLSLPLPGVGLIAGAVLARELAKAVRKMRAQGAEVRPISLATAESLRFPPGHPRTNIMYVGHPVDLGSYIPTADFHRYLFQHKVAEALRLIRSLGATTVKVRSVDGWNREAALRLGISLPAPTSGAAVDLEVKADQASASSEEVITTMALNPTALPFIPSDLVWLHHEPLWQEIADARIQSGLQQFSLDVRSSDDFGINASLKALVNKVGLDAGGKFVEHVDTVWRLEGEFGTP